MHIKSKSGFLVKTKMEQFFAVVWLCFCINVAAGISEGDKLESLKTLDGKTYSGVTISKISKESVRFIHSAGVATVSVQQLPEELLAGFGLSLAEAEVAKKEREQLQKQSAEQLQQRSELLSKSRIIDGRIIQVLSDKKAVLVELSKEGYVVSSAADNESRKKNLDSKNPFEGNNAVNLSPDIRRVIAKHETMRFYLKTVSVTYKWILYNDQQIVWIDMESTEGLIDDKMICGTFEGAKNWKKEMWIVEETGTTAYDAASGTRTVRRFKRRVEL